MLTKIFSLKLGQYVLKCLKSEFSGLYWKLFSTFSTFNLCFQKVMGTCCQYKWHLWKLIDLWQRSKIVKQCVEKWQLTVFSLHNWVTYCMTVMDHQWSTILMYVEASLSLALWKFVTCVFIFYSRLPNKAWTHDLVQTHFINYTAACGGCTNSSVFCKLFPHLVFS